MNETMGEFYARIKPEYEAEVAKELDKEKIKLNLEILGAFLVSTIYEIIWDKYKKRFLAESSSLSLN